jgi:hypothetical protein
LWRVHHGLSNTKKKKLGEHYNHYKGLEKLALIAKSLIIELLFNASFKDPYFYEYVQN